MIRSLLEINVHVLNPELIIVRMSQGEQNQK